MDDKNAALSHRDWHCSYKYLNKDNGNGDTMKYIKLLIKIASIVEIDYNKVTEVSNSIKDKDLIQELNEMIAENAIKKLCKELEEELI